LPATAGLSESAAWSRRYFFSADLSDSESLSIPICCILSGVENILSHCLMAFEDGFNFRSLANSCPLLANAKVERQSIESDIRFIFGKAIPHFTCINIAYKIISFFIKL